MSDAELDDYFNTYDDDANPDAIGCVVDDRYTVTWSAASPHPHLSRPAILTFMLHRSLYPSTTTASDFVHFVSMGRWFCVAEMCRNEWSASGASLKPLDRTVCIHDHT